MVQSSEYDPGWDYEVMGAYETLGTPGAPPGARLAALKLLAERDGAQHQPKPKPKPKPAGRTIQLPPGPLVALPLPRVLVGPAEIACVSVCPQRIVTAPYFLGLENAAIFSVRRLMFGQCMASYCPGDFPGEFLSVDRSLEWPEGLVPIRGESLNLGVQFSLEVHNRSAATFYLAGVLWATAVPECCCDLQWSTCELHGDRAIAAAGAGAEADRAATERHVSELEAGYELGDHWELPNAES